MRVSVVHDGSHPGRREQRCRWQPREASPARSARPACLRLGAASVADAMGLGPHAHMQLMTKEVWTLQNAAVATFVLVWILGRTFAAKNMMNGKTT